MTFALFVLYVVASYVYPGEMIPALAPYRITFWIGTAALVSAAVSPAFAARRLTASAGQASAGVLANVQLWALIAFAAVTALSLTIAERWAGAPVFTLQRFGPSVTTFVLALCSVTSLARLRLVTRLVIVLTVALTIQGAAAYHLGYNARTLLLEREAGAMEREAGAIEREGFSRAEDVEPKDVRHAPIEADDAAASEDTWGPPRIRGLGMMNDPNDLAMAMIVALGLLVAQAFRPAETADGSPKGLRYKETADGSPKGLRYKGLFMIAAGAVLVYGIVLTRSRGGVVALVILSWRYAAKRIGGVPALVLLLVLAVGAMTLDFGGRELSGQDESASDRIVAWSEGLEMLKAQPLLGVGYGQFVEHHTLTAHNSLVLCFAETGLIGCFFWVALLGVTMLELQRVKRLPDGDRFDGDARRCAEGLQLTLIGFMAAAFFLSRTFVPMLYLIVGLSAALAAIVRNAGRPLPLPPLRQLGPLVLAYEAGSIAIVYAIVKLHAA